MPPGKPIAAHTEPNRGYPFLSTSAKWEQEEEEDEEHEEESMFSVLLRQRCMPAFRKRSGSVQRAHSVHKAVSLAAARQPFIVSHDLGDYLGWDGADSLLDCPYANACKWYSLISPDGIVGHYKHRLWDVYSKPAPRGQPATLHWRALPPCTYRGDVAKCPAPRHVYSASGSIQDLWPLWQGLAPPPVELGVIAPWVYLRGTMPQPEVNAILSESIFDQLWKTGQFGKHELLMTIYTSQKGNQTNLHSDAVSGFVIQIVGRKRVVLFKPDDECFLRGATWGDPNAPDAGRRSWFQDGLPDEWRNLPPFNKLKGIEAEIGPGEALYIPNGWFHDVRSEDEETMGASIVTDRHDEGGVPDLVDDEAVEQDDGGFWSWLR
eukprot:gnl/TRDRNA2_/TRDRNA2_198407_c0_seq1.p1 gnl/TRDRNA2_/TRDRNA2_198407_c0~~gnl/TRDRNA2_/TRDRNA2_198407_c0_seq1.p1  ORF type:complete len:406 (+),score=41.06 gnl/TRDRNA2_/TRDRNA2_198407_c0_seq1:88-1218(+)